MKIIALPGFSEPFSSWTHLLAAGVALFGGYLLFRKGKGSGWRVFSLFIFSFSQIFLFSMSGVYHMLARGTTGRMVMMHLDHSAIFILIAATFTPIHTILFRGVWRWGILLLVWVLAITGVVLKIVFFEDIPELLGLSFYLGLGWLGILTGYKIKSRFEQDAFFWLWMGGVFYSIGAILEFVRWPVIVDGVIGPHEIFHIFVIFGALFHWILVYKWSSHPIKDVMIFHVKIFPENKYVAHAIGDHLQIEANNLEDLHSEIKVIVRKKYHKTISPDIHLKYFNEEII